MRLPAKKRRKKLTNAEKKANKEIRESLREKGFLPPVKPKLNRARFAVETINEFGENLGTCGDIGYLLTAINCMTPCIDMGAKQTKVTPEHVGVLKVMKLALEIKKFSLAKKEQGEANYTIGELYDKVISPILNL